MTNDHAADRPAGRPQLIATVAELAALAAAVEPDAPVFIDDAQIEPGSDPADHKAWAVVAQRQLTLANEAGQAAGPGEQVGTSAPDEHGRRHLLGTPVLMLTERRLATPGVIGPVAHPADPETRRYEAYELRSDQDLTRYLMELLDAVERLRVETERDAHDDDQQFHPLARAHLGTAAAHLQQARAAIDRATGYGIACELIRGYDLDDDSGSPCDAERLYDVLVWLPDEGYEELACPVHGAVVVRVLPGATSRPNPNADYGKPRPNGDIS
ncbi:hypothetical protein [Streptosporangium lutulentum]|uniref:Uncharacterized protein n=1 Tax=Streptosporangium lutulentum TaxID=1461250 RepID=A0ABT9QU96_9ACTN|nr:hypothetical protein [Streptosporangium lutulentum]MDP9850337.1 hypothetical protein [Streptosporangium lutulentum]